MERRNYALDTLRGLAAIGILIWHYQHFFELGKFAQPFESDLAFFYKYGWTMVDFFFCLSGFIFYQKYSLEIAEKRVSLRCFVILRLSRLYPLIVVTLLATAVLNYTLLYAQHKFFIYSHNDFSTFFLNLLFLQSGFFNVGFSFNAPTWSLGVEFWVYLLFFFLVIRCRENLAITTVAIALLFLSLVNKQVNLGFVLFTPDFERGICGFFLGGSVYFLLTLCQPLSDARRNLIGIAALVVAIVAIVLVWLKLSMVHSAVIGSLMAFENLALVLVAFPSLILAFTVSPLLERLFSRKFLETLGDISYSSYLWHIPIQLTVFGIILVFDHPINFGSEKFFFFYLGFVLLVAYLSTRFFEKPVQRWIRSKYLERQAL